MKNIVIGIVGVCVIVYTFFIGLDILKYQTSKNEMEKQVSRIVKHVLENEYQTEDAESVKQMLLQEMKSSISSNDAIEVKIQAMDLQKGLLSVKVTRDVKLLNGKKKEIIIEKTAIMERAYRKDGNPEVS